jgi:uncharacterized protein YndB with AHSA1/START domain
MSAPTERSVDHQYFIRAEPAAVFRALTEPKWLTRWLCDTAEISPKKGGSYSFGWKGGPTHTGAIVEFVPGEKIAFAWRWPSVELGGTVFSLAVEPQEGGALLRILHTGFPRREEWTDLYGGAEWGWTYFAMNLKSLLEHGHDLRAPSDG